MIEANLEECQWIILSVGQKASQWDAKLKSMFLFEDHWECKLLPLNLVELFKNIQTDYQGSYLKSELSWTHDNVRETQALEWAFELVSLLQDLYPVKWGIWRRWSSSSLLFLSPLSSLFLFLAFLLLFCSSASNYLPLTAKLPDFFSLSLKTFYSEELKQIFYFILH